MSAKPAKKSARKPTPKPAVPAPTAEPATIAAGGVSQAIPAATADTSSAWLDSTDPRKRMLGKLVLAGLCLYIGALWLLALDQTFHWGIFGPAIPPAS